MKLLVSNLLLPPLIPASSTFYLHSFPHVRDFSSELTSFRTSSSVLTSSKVLFCFVLLVLELSFILSHFYTSHLCTYDFLSRITRPQIRFYLTSTRATLHFCSLVLEFVFTFLSPSRALLSTSAHSSSNSLASLSTPALATFYLSSFVL